MPPVRRLPLALAVSSLALVACGSSVEVAGPDQEPGCRWQAREVRVVEGLPDDRASLGVTLVRSSDEPSVDLVWDDHEAIGRARLAHGEEIDTSAPIVTELLTDDLAGRPRIARGPDQALGALATLDGEDGRLRLLEQREVGEPLSLSMPTALTTDHWPELGPRRADGSRLVAYVGGLPVLEAAMVREGQLETAVPVACRGRRPVILPATGGHLVAMHSQVALESCGIGGSGSRGMLEIAHLSDSGVRSVRHFVQHTVEGAQILILYVVAFEPQSGGLLVVWRLESGCVGCSALPQPEGAFMQRLDAEGRPDSAAVELEEPILAATVAGDDVALVRWRKRDGPASDQPGVLDLEMLDHEGELRQRVPLELPWSDEDSDGDLLFHSAKAAADHNLWFANSAGYVQRIECVYP